MPQAGLLERLPSSGARRSCPPAPPQAAHPDRSSVGRDRRSWSAAGAPRRQTGGGPPSRGARGWRAPCRSTAPGGNGGDSALLAPPTPLPGLCEVLLTRLTTNMATVAQPKMDSWTAAQSFRSHPRTWVHLRGGEPSESALLCTPTQHPHPSPACTSRGPPAVPRRGRRPPATWWAGSPSSATGRTGGR